MSKQQTAKEKQGYNPKPVFPMCSNCKHYSMQPETTNWGYTRETNIRCGIGGFAIKKQGTCNSHDFK